MEAIEVRLFVHHVDNITHLFNSATIMALTRMIRQKNGQNLLKYSVGIFW